MALTSQATPQPIESTFMAREAANIGRLTRHEGGFDGLWSGLTGKRQKFPLESLIVLPQTLTQFVRGERG